nr:aspartate--tRNA ligase [Candidatus Vampirococcus lugosii]
MKYRYLDLRRENMKDNIITRHNMTKKIFDYLVDNDFLYIETPSLIKNTPEGAREYIVPSRNNPGEAYVLPQSPQQLKQMLMLSGFDRYFQIARCFRDEDLRGDRQPEFTQIDIELSFAEQNDIIDIISNLFGELTKELFDNKLINDEIPIISWEDVMNRYGIDKPELRTKEMQIIDISDIASKSDLKVFGDVVNKGGVIKSMVVDSIFTRSQIDKYTSLLQEKGAKGLAYIIWDEEGPKSPILKFFSDDLQKELFEKLGLSKGKTAFFQATDWLLANEYLGYLRTILIRDLELTKGKENELNFAWIVDFPMFEIDEETGKFASMHHPFTKPKEEFVPFLKEIGQKLKLGNKLTEEEKKQVLNVKADAYDLTLNGYEIAGGSVRIYDQELQETIFYILGMNETEIEERFGHMTQAFKYGVPPHAGIAIGFDRVVMIYQNMPNIREVIPFPKTQK